MTEKTVPGTIGREDRLTLHYSVHCRGQMLETSTGGEPLEYTMSSGDWPLQLELAMLDQPAGTELSVVIDAAENAFGKADPERIMQMDLADFEEVPEPGTLIEFALENGESVEGQVLSVMGDSVQVDFNHPYAGRDLVFEIRIESEKKIGEENERHRIGLDI